MGRVVNGVKSGLLVKASNMGTTWSSSAVFVLEDDPQAGWIRFPGVHPPVVVPDPGWRSGWWA